MLYSTKTAKNQCGRHEHLKGVLKTLKYTFTRLFCLDTKYPAPKKQMLANFQVCFFFFSSDMCCTFRGAGDDTSIVPEIHTCISVFKINDYNQCTAFVLKLLHAYLYVFVWNAFHFTGSSAYVIKTNLNLHSWCMGFKLFLRRMAVGHYFWSQLVYVPKIFWRIPGDEIVRR